MMSGLPSCHAYSNLSARDTLHRNSVSKETSKSMKRLLIGGAILAGLWLTFGRTKPPQVVEAPPPAVVSAGSEREAPRQDSIARPHVFSMNGYELRTLAQFGLTARALSVTDYRMGRESDLSPLDIAFGWGRMSEPPVSDRLSISQSNRWYYWRFEGEPPIPPREIETSSANMHLIPADAGVARALGKIRKGQIVKLSGYLVEIKAKDGWSWRSSMTRDDTGQGSCEVIFVQAVNASG